MCQPCRAELYKGLYPPKKLQLPPNLADTPETREAYSRHLAEITYMDGKWMKS